MAQRSIPDPALRANHLLGTEGDPQKLSVQEALLREAGVILTESNALAARLSAAIVG